MDLRYFIWLVELSWFNPLFIMPGIILALLAVCYASRSAKADLFQLKSLALFIPSVLALCVSVCGAIFASPIGSPRIQPCAVPLILVLLLVQFPLMLALLWIFPRFRAVVFILCLLQGWGAGLAAFVSYMSVTGNWL